MIEDHPRTNYIPQEVHPMAAERFAAKVDTNGPISLVRGVTGNCHVWTAGTFTSPHDGTGQFGEEYGKFTYEGRNVGAHRFAYMQAYGPIQPLIRADGTEVRTVLDHRCRRRNCVRPDHLEVVDDRTNNRRGHSPAARNATKTHCAKGHPYDDTNTYIEFTKAHPSGMRRCRACDRARAAAYRARKRAQAQQTTPTTLERAA
jgi:hypothetical protein